MKDIELKGKFTQKKNRPDTFNITHRSELALKHIFELSDAGHNYVNYIGAALCEDPPHFVHHRLGWTEALPYSVHGAIVGRNIAGYEGGKDIQAGQRSLMLSHFNELDGMVHAPKSPWNEKYPVDIWEQTRTLYALIYWFFDTGEEKLLDYAGGIVDALFSLSEQHGNERIFPSSFIGISSMGPYAVGSIIDPLVKYYEITGNTKALQLALGTTHFMLNPDNGYFNSGGGFNGFFRTVVSFHSGLSNIAALTGDDKLLSSALKFHDKAISQCTSFGSTPCCEPVCSDFELNMSALSLIKAGHEEYWDQIDRFIRNQIAEAQFLDASEWIREKATKKRINRYNIYDYYPDDLQILPYDDYRDIVERSIGGFMWSTADEHMYFPASLMVCCTSHALRSFEIVWKYALVESKDTLTANFNYNFENNLGEIISYEPFKGKMTVIPKKPCRLKMRIPEYAIGGKITGYCDDKQTDIIVDGRYAVFENAQQGSVYTLEYPLNKRTTEEKQLVYEYPDYENPIETKVYEASWRGNTVIKLTPESKEEKRIYKRAELDKDTVPYSDVSYYITEKKLY